MKQLYMHGLSGLNVINLSMLRKTLCYRHLHISENFLRYLFSVCLVYYADDCMKSVFLLLHVFI